MFLIISIPLFFINKYFALVFLLVAIIIGIVCVISTYKFKKNKNMRVKELDNLEQKINHEIEILERNQEEQEDKIDEIEEKYNVELMNMNDSVRNKYIGIVDLEFINIALEMNEEELLVAVSNKENRINSLKFNLQSRKHIFFTNHVKFYCSLDSTSIHLGVRNYLQPYDPKYLSCPQS